MHLVNISKASTDRFLLRVGAHAARSAALSSEILLPLALLITYGTSQTTS